MDSLMNLESLPIDARALIYFHICSTEQELTSKVSDDLSLPYVRFRELEFDMHIDSDWTYNYNA